MNRIWFIPIIFLALSACHNTQEDKSDSKVIDSHMTRIIDSGRANQANGASEGTTVETDNEVPASEKIDLTKPDLVVNQMIRYAKDGNYESLKSLCSQEALQQKDNQMLCSGNMDLFHRLANATITADNIDVKGKIATVPIAFNDNKNPQKAMVDLVLKGKNWYVSQIENTKLNHQ